MPHFPSLRLLTTFYCNSDPRVQQPRLSLAAMKVPPYQYPQQPLQWPRQSFHGRLQRLPGIFCGATPSLCVGKRRRNILPPCSRNKFQSRVGRSSNKFRWCLTGCCWLIFSVTRQLLCLSCYCYCRYQHRGVTAVVPGGRGISRSVRSVLPRLLLVQPIFEPEKFKSIKNMQMYDIKFIFSNFLLMFLSFIMIVT